VPLPHPGKSRPPTDLSESNCPLVFVSFLRVWAKSVPQIQGLSPGYQHDLARIICGLEPLSQPLNRSLSGIAADLRAVAIEISQRRTFQDRYAADLQAAINAGGPNTSATVSFVPPPVYNPSPSPQPSTRLSPRTLKDERSPSRNSTKPSVPGSSYSSSPKVLAASSSAIDLIRETLYAALADVIERSPSLRRLLRSDPPRAYFASVAFAILELATVSITQEGSVRGVLGQEMTIQQCPHELKPLMLEFAAISLSAKDAEEEDDREAVELVSRGKQPPEPQMERVRKVLERGIGYDVRSMTELLSPRSDDEDDKRSIGGRAVALANKINGLALSMTGLQAFRDRQKDVFAVLAGIGS
jgi:hypothetical protein